MQNLLYKILHIDITQNTSMRMIQSYEKHKIGISDFWSGELFVTECIGLALTNHMNIICCK